MDPYLNEILSSAMLKQNILFSTIPEKLKKRHALMKQLKHDINSRKAACEVPPAPKHFTQLNKQPNNKNTF